MELSKLFFANGLPCLSTAVRALLLLVLLAPHTSLAQHGAEPQQQTHGETSHGQGDVEHQQGQAESPWAILFKWANFLILFGGLGWYLRKPLGDFLDSRSRGIQEELSAARAARENSRRKLTEIELRLSRLDQEMQTLKALALKEAEDERARILEGARQEAVKILEMARREIGALQRSAQQELKSHVADLAVKLAEERLRGAVGAEENKRIVQQFLKSLDARKN